ncbi:unnamed protein product [Penicillium roqueforti FM164]|uniref:Uncharacterized protein n=1 Tax=Penicillium roqueforti (strain FM164) TaxID=1365484 RepID=W6QKU9_PENRF|nr:unnamed protein product [Penicillium roqueforti FM164]
MTGYRTSANVQHMFDDDRSSFSFLCWVFYGLLNRTREAYFYGRARDYCTTRSWDLAH